MWKRLPHREDHERSVGLAVLEGDLHRLSGRPEASLPLYEAALTMAHRLHAPRDHHTVAQAHLNPLKSQSQMNGPFVNHSFSNSSFGTF